MLKVLSNVLYQLRAETVRSGQMIDSSSIHYPLYPLSPNAQRMMRFSGSSDAVAITPYEVSSLLYQISLEDFSALRVQAQESQAKIKEIDNQILPLRLASLITNKEYRYGNYSKNQLEEKEKFITLTADYLQKLLKFTQVSDLPVGVASNAIFAAAKLGLDFNQALQESLIPLISKKVQHLTAKGIIESLWGLVILKNQDKVVFNLLLNELKQRRPVALQQVVTSPFNHLEYIYDNEPQEAIEVEMLNKVAEVVDGETKKSLEAIAGAYRR